MDKDPEIIDDIKSLFGNLKHPPEKTEKEQADEWMRRKYPDLIIKK